MISASIPVRIATRRLLRPLGLELTRIGATAEWLEGYQPEDPLTYQYFTDLRHAPPFWIELEDACFGIMGFPFDRASLHPFILAFRRAFDAPNEQASVAAVRSTLSSYYDTVQPLSAVEALDVSPEDAPGLAQVPPSLWVLPWGTNSIEERAWHLRFASVAGSLSNKRRIVAAKHGMTNFGPVAATKLDFEVERVMKLVASLKANGFTYSNKHPMEVTGLRSGNEWRWFTLRGQHRFAACAVLGIERVKVNVVRVVRREDVHAWPRVVNRTFTAKGAQQVFDRVFSKTPPSCAARWRDLNSASEVAPMSAPQPASVQQAL